MGDGWAFNQDLDVGAPEDIDPVTQLFPNNVALTLYQEFASIEGVDSVYLRPLRDTDPDACLGVFAMDWIPGEAEINGRGNSDPTLSTYLFGVQAFVKHTSREEGLLKHALLSKMVRLMLYRQESLRVRLAGLTEQSFNTIERAQRWGIRQQRFMANEVDKSFLYLSTTEFWLQTETVF